MVEHRLPAGAHVHAFAGGASGGCEQGGAFTLPDLCHLENRPHRVAMSVFKINSVCHDGVFSKFAWDPR